MTDSRLTHLLRLCDEALSHDQASRGAYLDAACAGDAALRAEVDALLNDEAASESFLETAPAIPPAEPLKIGQRLGPYEVTGLLGTGGMGAVYRARDTRLGRTVAIKVLGADAVVDDTARERFLEEARAVASLNDPRICALHDVGREGDIDFLVLEYVEGQTLEERLTSARLPLPVALEYGVQLADALAHAHRHGLVHRDVKPGNVMVTKSAVKLLDFGLARIRRLEVAAGEAAAATTRVGTKTGMVLGTVPYMAPEQLEAKEADARTDLFGLGCVLYEMLSGCRPFAGDSEASVIAAIKSTDPRPLAELQPLVPPVVEQAITRCLAKDPQDRWQSASDLADVLRWAARLPGGRVPSGGRARARWTVVALALACTALVSLGGWALWRERNTATPQPQHFELSLSSLNASLASHSLAISPDGQTVVFAASRPGEAAMLYVRTLRDAATRRLNGTEAAWLPFFSPDGQEIAFGQGRDLVRLRLRDGVRQSICQAPEFAGGVWGDDGGIVYAGGYLNPGLASVSAEGGTATPLLKTDDQDLQSWYLLPERLPGGAFVFTIRRGPQTEVAAYSPAHGLRRNVIAGASRARYVGAGLLAYEFGGQLRVVGFDTARLERRGESSVVVGALATGFDSPAYAVSRTGTLVYLPSYQGLSRLVWKDRRGNSTKLALPPGRFSPPPALSHDGRRLVVQVDQGARRNLWIADVDGEVFERLTDSGDDWLPEFWPDNKWIAFTRGEAYDICRVRLDRTTTTPEPLVVGPVPKSMPAISRDGRTILFNYAAPRPQVHIWRRELADPPDAIKPFFVAPSATADKAPAFSPDGRWLAYQSDASGIAEVYVQQFPEGRGNQVSVGGGAWPRWNPALREAGNAELFYEGSGHIFSARIVDGRRAGPPVPLFRHVVGEGWDRVHERDRRDYAVSGDGERFLMAETIESASRPSQIHVITNWLEELKQKLSFR